MMISLVLNRLRHGEKSTLGQLLTAKGQFLSWMLERGPGPNRRGIDRIPAGEYRLERRFKDENDNWEMGWAKRLNQPVVEIVGVPDRSLVLCHPVNRWTGLEGCLGPGMRYTREDDGEYAVWSSRDAFAKVNPYMLATADAGDTLLITDENP
jgi:hypothetical protein